MLEMEKIYPAENIEKESFPTPLDSPIKLPVSFETNLIPSSVNIKPNNRKDDFDSLYDIHLQNSHQGGSLCSNYTL
jgi:hypothetical protein